MRVSDEALADYVRDLADRMRLADWVFFVSSDPEAMPGDGIDDVRCGTFAGTYGRKSARIWINAEWWKEVSPEERRETIVHEVLHAHFHSSHETVSQMVTTHPRRTADALLGIYDVQSEYAVDAIAHVLAPFLPLPPAIEEAS